jgi:flagellar export protein FliJ
VRAYRFRLDAVVRVRRLHEHIAGQDLSLALPARPRAQAPRADARRSLDRLQQPQGQIEAGAVQWTLDQSDRMAASLTERTERARDAASAADEASREWTTAKQRCTVLERLDDRQRTVWQEMLGREETSELDDMASVRFAEARWAR